MGVKKVDCQCQNVVVDDDEDGNISLRGWKYRVWWCILVRRVVERLSVGRQRRETKLRIEIQFGFGRGFGMALGVDWVTVSLSMICGVRNIIYQTWNAWLLGDVCGIRQVVGDRGKTSNLHLWEGEPTCSSSLSTREKENRTLTTAGFPRHTFVARRRMVVSSFGMTVVVRLGFNGRVRLRRINLKG